MKQELQQSSEKPPNNLRVLSPVFADGIRGLLLAIFDNGDFWVVHRSEILDETRLLQLNYRGGPCVFGRYSADKVIAA